MTGIVDYEAGNLTSVVRALRHLGEPCRISNDPRILDGSDRILFPGVGAAGDAMSQLRRRGLDRWIRGWALSGKPLLGICLGMQVVFDHSEENDTACLGIVSGRVRRFPADGRDEGGYPLKVPHMGWNRVVFARVHPVFDGIAPEAEFYFVHGYCAEPADGACILGRTHYGGDFCSVAATGAIVAVQFHPEKSGRPGLEVLRNFCRWEGADAQ